MLRSKFFIALLVCAVPCIIGFFITQINHTHVQKQATPQENNQRIPDRPPTITMKNITLHEYEKKRGYEFVMTAEEGNFDHTTDKVECCNLACKILQRGTCVAHIHAKKSLIDQSNKQLLCQGQIKGIWKDLTIEGSDIGYSFLNQTMKTKKIMTYTHPQFNLSANQSTINLETETIHMSNGVHTEFFSNNITH